MENEDESPPMDPPETAEQQIEVNDDGLPVDVGQGLEAFQAERDQMIAEKIQEDNGEAAAFALTSPEEAPEEAQQDEINDRAADVYNQQPEQPVILQ